MNARQPALIFDFGNVVAFFDYTRACEHLGRKRGISGDEFLRQVQERGLTPLIQQYERGGMASREFSRTVCSLADLDVSHDEFASAWADIFWLNEPIAALVRDLKANGYTLVLGSNTNELHAAQFRGQFAEALAHFDRLVLSYEVGHIKPAPEFYLACAQAANARPGDCIFIDDLPENVEGARAAGLAAIHFRDLDNLVRDLRFLGVNADAPRSSATTRGPL